MDVCLIRTLAKGRSMPKAKLRLVCSAPSEAQLTAMLCKYFYSQVRLVPTIDGSFDVHNSKGAIVGMAVRNHKGRWRAELVQSEA